MVQPDAAIPVDVEGETLDTSALDTLRELGDDAFVRELVDDFATSMEEYLPSLRVAAQEGDAQTVYRTAHTVKSSSASLGAMRVSALAARIEQAGRGGALDGVAAAIEALANESAIAVARLRDVTL